jgi:formylglycine-generating enzyme required for sulfatase activity
VVASVPGACAHRVGPSEVGSAPDGKSPFGALDLSGNVWEWVADPFGPYDGPPESSGRGVLRGGSWDYAPTTARTTYRLPYMANAGNASTGFRCAKDD